MKILILEDNDERIEAFRDACGMLSADLILWNDARRMVEEMQQHLGTATAISLDHDLADIEGEAVGSGMDVVQELVSHKPSCPIFLHTSNTSASWSMRNELQRAGWSVQRISPVTMGTAWIKEDWLPAVRTIVKKAKGNPAIQMETGVKRYSLQWHDPQGMGFWIRGINPDGSFYGEIMYAYGDPARSAGTTVSGQISSADWAECQKLIDGMHIPEPFANINWDGQLSSWTESNSTPQILFRYRLGDEERSVEARHFLKLKRTIELHLSDQYQRLKEFSQKTHE
jgi:type II secretory pathway component PulJ